MAIKWAATAASVTIAVSQVDTLITHLDSIVQHGSSIHRVLASELERERILSLCGAIEQTGRSKTDLIDAVDNYLRTRTPMNFARVHDSLDKLREGLSYLAEIVAETDISNPALSLSVQQQLEHSANQINFAVRNFPKNLSEIRLARLKKMAETVRDLQVSGEQITSRINDHISALR